MSFRKAKVLACATLIILIVSLWLFLITNMKNLQIIFVILGAILTTLIVCYVVIMLGIILMELIEGTSSL